MGAGYKFYGKNWPKTVTAFSKDIKTRTADAVIMLDELNRNKAKYTLRDLLFLTKSGGGPTVYLERGNKKKGLKHIWKIHFDDFAKNFGLKKSELVTFLQKTLSDSQLIFVKERQIEGRTGYDKTYYSGGKYAITYGIGSNGFIVTAYPQNLEEFVSDLKKDGKQLLVKIKPSG